MIAAVSGYAVAGGLELALWCDMRIAEQDSTFGVFCRRWGVPLIDGGTVRLPRIVGAGRAMDMILTGRAVAAPEALQIGLVNRVVGPGESRSAAERLAAELAALPQTCLRSDRMSALEQWGWTNRRRWPASSATASPRWPTVRSRARSGSPAERAATDRRPERRWAGSA